MAKEIRWTPTAIKTFKQVIDYLDENWSEREIKNFILATEKILEFISENPRMFRSTMNANVREALVTPHNLLICKICRNRMELITFWYTRQNPVKKKY